MKIKLIYPAPKKQRRYRLILMNICKWLFPLSSLMLAALNLVTGGAAWCVVPIWSMYFIWTQLVSPDMVEFNRVSQVIKLVVNSCVLLTLIDIFLAPGWAVEVVPIICFSALIISGVLLFTDFEVQRQNMLPILLLCAACIAGAAVGLSIFHGEERWALAVMGVAAFSLLIGCAFKLGKDFISECKKRFGVK